MILLALLLAQVHLVFSPSEQKIPQTVWSFAACLPADAPGVTLRQGELFQMLALHGAKPLTNSETLAALHRKEFRSWPARLVRWPGYVAVGTSLFLTTDAIKVTSNEKKAIGAAAGLLLLLTSVIQRSLPLPPSIEAELTGSVIPIAAGGCTNGVMLGGPGVAFEAFL